MNKKALPIAIMVCSSVAMVAVNVFSLHISSIVLMLLAAVVSLALFLLKDDSSRRGGKAS